MTPTKGWKGTTCSIVLDKEFYASLCKAFQGRPIPDGLITYREDLLEGVFYQKSLLAVDSTSAVET